jgi:hypothetical protein
MIRKLWWAVLAIGVFGVIAPFALGLPGKVSAGEDMMQAFEPIMEEENVKTTSDYYYNVFVPLGDVAPAMSQENIDTFNAYLAGFGALGEDAANMIPVLADALGMTEEQVQGFMAEQFPAMMQTLQALPQMEEDFGNLLGLMDANVAIFEQVPGGLEHYEPLEVTMEQQYENYADAASMPDFRAFTWVFLIPGIALVAISLIALIGGRKKDAESESDEADAADSGSDAAEVSVPVG